MPKATNTQWELRLRSEYLVKYHAGDIVQTHVPLGAFPAPVSGIQLSADEYKILGVWRRYADAVVFKGHEVLVIEFAIFPHPGDISLVQHYCRLFPQTPELETHRSKRVQPMIVGAVEDPAVTMMAREQGILWTLYSPPWVSDYLQIIAEQKRAAARKSASLRAQG